MAVSLVSENALLITFLYKIFLVSPIDMNFMKI